MKRLLVLAFCLILFSHLPAFAQNYSGPWHMKVHITYTTVHNGDTHGNYEGFVTVSQTDFSPPMPINLTGNLQLYFSDDVGYPPEIPLNLNFTMPDSNTIPDYNLPIPPPYDLLIVTINGSISGSSASGLITSTLPTGGLGPISGTWEAKKLELPSAVPTMTEWGLGILCTLLLLSGFRLIRIRRTV